MPKFAVLKQQFAQVAKTALSVVVVSVIAVTAVTGAHADAPNVTEVVSDLDALEAPIALVGGAYIGLKVFKRGWQIIRGFI